MPHQTSRNRYRTVWSTLGDLKQGRKNFGERFSFLGFLGYFSVLKGISSFKTVKNCSKTEIRKKKFPNFLELLQYHFIGLITLYSQPLRYQEDLFQVLKVPGVSILTFKGAVMTRPDPPERSTKEVRKKYENRGRDSDKKYPISWKLLYVKYSNKLA